MAFLFSGSSTPTGSTTVGFKADGINTHLTFDLSQQPFNLDLASLGSGLTLSGSPSCTIPFTTPQGLNTTGVYNLTYSIDYGTSIVTVSLAVVQTNPVPPTIPVLGAGSSFSFSFLYTSL